MTDLYLMTYTCTIKPTIAPGLCPLASFGLVNFRPLRTSPVFTLSRARDNVWRESLFAYSGICMGPRMNWFSSQTFGRNENLILVDCTLFVSSRSLLSSTSHSSSLAAVPVIWLANTSSRDAWHHVQTIDKASGLCGVRGFG